MQMQDSSDDAVLRLTNGIGLKIQISWVGVTWEFSSYKMWEWRCPCWAVESALPAVIMLIFTVITKTWEGHLWRGCFEVKAKCLYHMSRLPWENYFKNEIKTSQQDQISHFLSPWKLSVVSVKYRRKGHASVSWWRSLSPGTCMYWRMARRIAASIHPHLHNNEVKNKSYSSRKALSSWTYFFPVRFSRIPINGRLHLQPHEHTQLRLEFFSTRAVEHTQMEQQSEDHWRLYKGTFYCLLFLYITNTLSEWVFLRSMHKF